MKRARRALPLRVLQDDLRAPRLATASPPRRRRVAAWPPRFRRVAATTERLRRRRAAGPHRAAATAFGGPISFVPQAPPGTSANHLEITKPTGRATLRVAASLSDRAGSPISAPPRGRARNSTRRPPRPSQPTQPTAVPSWILMWSPWSSGTTTRPPRRWRSSATSRSTNGCGPFTATSSSTRSRPAWRPSRTPRPSGRVAGSSGGALVLQEHATGRPTPQK